MYVLGVWDQHDAGAALIEDNKIVFAANEERFTKRKLEMRFPTHSIHAALNYAGLKPGDIEHIAVSTTELTKTLERLLPYSREYYYNFRRRKIPKPMFENFRHNLKYSMTGIGMLPGTTALSKYLLARELRHMGFKKFKLHVVEHHVAHAATAAFTSRFKKSLVLTLDGLGDGLSGSISIFENGNLERRLRIPARDSLGIFFEQVTNIIGMRELEDEGKVMAMADYSYPFDIEENRMKDFFKVEGTNITAKYNTVKQFGILQSIAWQMPREQFAYMAQQLLEAAMLKFVGNAIGRYNIGDVVMAGGTFSNVKANMRIRSLDALKHWYVFPHMGDGGIALGAAMYAGHMLTGSTSYSFSPYLGSAYTDEETARVLKGERPFVMQEESPVEQASHAAELIDKGNYIFWFHDRMEYGPRALGNRSILAPTGSEGVKDRLNTYVKKREWFQPFAPSMLEEDAGKVLEYDSKGADKFMTTAYIVRKDMREMTRAVMHIDGSARPQMVGGENPAYYRLLKKVKDKSGIGMVLNTSFNIHGMPIVLNPYDAAETMKKTKTKYMFINGFFVTNKAGV
ncbi:Carbamoyltransferase [mine drainage metagenome]|uniref:Carbamoyltransferase n=1 Tax=mine drainage metagenome TaxID=410659 RepID=T0YZ14_9ZZZZ